VTPRTPFDRAAFRRAGTLLALALLALVPTARATALDPDAATRLDPRLAARLADPSPVTAWVTFADKGERGPADLARRLAEAEASLTPASRARRLRAGMRPLVDYDDLPVCEAYLDDLRARGLAPYGASRGGNEVAVSVPGTRLAELARLPQVARLRPVERVERMREEPAGPEVVAPAPSPLRDRALAAASLSYGRSWSQLSLINVPAVHDSGYVGTGVTIAVLDNGFNFHQKHQATRGADIPPGFQRDFVEGDTVVTDTVVVPGNFRHGMWTLSCMAGNAPGQYIGSAPGARYALARTENQAVETLQELVWWRMGAEWADSLGADVISSSLGYSTMDNPADDLTYAMRDGHTSVATRAALWAARRGILVVTAAGNYKAYGFPFNKVLCPGDADGDSVITMGAVYQSGLMSWFSSEGPNSAGLLKPDLVARGVSDSMASASGDPNGYITNDGTSFSTPIVAGLAACLIQARPSWPATTVIQSLYRTAARAAAPDTIFGRGLPDGLAALRWTPDTAVVPPPPPLPAGFVRLALLGANPALPGRASTWVRLTLGTDAEDGTFVRARVFDTQGRQVRSLWAGALRRGESRSVEWDGVDDDGRALRSGVYFVSVEGAGRVASTRLVSLR
jgi:serine protease AprX